MTLLLVSETAIVKQIFSLVCKKLDLKLESTNNTNISEKYDFIIIDQSFIDDKFNIVKQYSNRLGAISSEELPFDKSRDFLIPRPFLPTKLQEILKEQIEFLDKDLKEESENQTYVSAYADVNEDIKAYEDENDITVPVVDYVESLADDVSASIKEEGDESIISLAAMDDGGVLDNGELSKISDILKENEIHDKINYDNEDWKDISDLIDDALDEVKEYEFDLDNPNESFNPINLYLSNYNMKELRPLLEKFNQETIDKLSAGHSVDIRLKLKDN